ncbi:MAG TPA: cysteine desulfurase [Longimicrobiales bacterium]|nr:cysteine desulfurase [Longimicrobiales bacterium]
MTTTAAALDVTAMRARFPLFANQPGERPLAYMDSAATSQKPDDVIDAVSNFYRTDNANVHRGLYDLARRATEAYEGARSTIARFINARDDSEIVWLRGTTEAINLVAATWTVENLREGDEILVSVMEHHSNLVPWQLAAQRTGARVRAVDIDEECRLRLDQMRDILASGRVRLVAVGHVSNSIGTIHPIREIADMAHAAGALLLVDGAQAAPHLPVDVQALGCDFYAFSGHKMCGPMGIGALWARRELLDAMPPYQGGGEMIDIVEIERSTWAKVPHKFEAGTPNGAGAVGMAAAARFLTDVGHDAIWSHEQELVRYGIDRLARVEGLRMFGPTDPAQRVAVFSFTLEGVHPHDVGTVLDAEGIAVRAGHHCTQPLMRRLGVPATTRASLYLYNSTDEIDRLADGLGVARRLFDG